MDFSAKLSAAWAQHDSLLCIGLDPDVTKFPASVASADDPIFVFNKAIVDATGDLACAFKPNIAFYEAAGEAGMRALGATIDYIHERWPGVLVMLDAKRADIGNTNDAYVQQIFDQLHADAVTLHPYLGGEALQPFLDRADKGCIVLCRTSNPGAGELQDLLIEGKPLYEHVAKQVAESWNGQGNCGLVVGATYPEEMRRIREIVGDKVPFLVPGIGAQGGNVEATVKAGVTHDGTGLLISSSRAILYASNGDDFAEAARTEAARTVKEINQYRS